MTAVNNNVGAPKRRRSGLPIVVASDSRIGRIRRCVKRAFIVSNGQPITVRDVLARAYPRLRRFNDWHRWSCRRALLTEGAIVIARMRFTRGRPNLWLPCTAVASLLPSNRMKPDESE